MTAELREKIAAIIRAGVKPALPSVVEAFAAYNAKPENGAWGHLHIVLDDANLSNDSVKFCKECAEKSGDADGALLADVLLLMSKTQRGRLGRDVFEYRLAAGTSEYPVK